MKRERVTEEELRAAVRGQGLAQMDEVVAVIMETDGSLNVIVRADERSWTALANVRGAEFTSHGR